MKLLVRKMIFIVVIILFCISLQGCEIKSQSKTAETDLTAQNNLQNGNESSQPLPIVYGIGPLQEAEAEELLAQGLKFYEQYNYEKALAKFDEAIAVNPANFKIYTAKGIALCFQGDYQNGIAMIQKTLTNAPDYVPAFYDMAMAYKLQNDYDQSLYWFAKTIQGDPDNTWSYYGIATIYADRGEKQESLRYLQKAIELEPAVKTVAQEQEHFAKMRNIPEFQALVR